MIGESTVVLLASEISRAVTAVGVLHLPGFRQIPVSARILLGVCIAWACFSAKWAAQSPSAAISIDSLWLQCGRNLITGMAVALFWNLVLEACSLAVQLASVQSGLSYASIIDPTNDTESGSLLGITQFCVLITFLTAGVHLQFLTVLLEADSIWDGFSRQGPTLVAVHEMLAYSFRTGLRLAAPFIASMLLLDIASALGARFAERFQLSVLIFPVKWAATLIILAVSAVTLHRLEAVLSTKALELLTAMR